MGGQALDLQIAQPKQGAAVGHQEQAHLVAFDVDVSARPAPRGGGVTGGAQARQRRCLGCIPGRVAEVAALGQFPLFAKLRQDAGGVGVGSAGPAFECAFGLHRHTRDFGAHAGFNRQPHFVGLASAAAWCAFDAHDGAEVALGLQQFTNLGG